MLTLIYGTQQQLNHHFSGPAFARDQLWLVKKQPLSSAWQPITDLLNQLESKLGKTKVVHELTLNQAAASFACPSLIDQLDPVQQVMRQFYSARTDSHLSHASHLQRPLYDAWARIINTLLHDPKHPEKTITVVVPFCHQLIGPVNEVIKTLLGSFPASRVNFIMGYDTNKPAPVFGNNGITHDIQSCFPCFGDDFLPMADSIVNLKNEDAYSGAVKPLSILGKRDVTNDIILKSHAVLETVCDPLTSGQIIRVIDAMQIAFEGYDFQNTLHLGLSLLEHKVQLEQPQRAQCHTLVSLAAHNRQIDKDDMRLNSFLEYHLLAAYEAQDKPADRSALCCRLAELYGRRLKKFDKALRWTQKALTYAASTRLQPSQQLYCHCWAMNIKTFVLAHTEKPLQAFELGSNLFDNVHEHYRQLQVRLSESPNANILLWQREFFVTVQVLRRTMFSLCQTAKHFEHYRCWLDKMELITPDSDEFKRSTHLEWAQYFDVTHQPKSMTEAVNAGFDCLKQAPQNALNLSYCRQAIQAYDKSGNITTAMAHLANYQQTINKTGMAWFDNSDIVDFGPLYLRSRQHDILQLLEQQPLNTQQTDQQTQRRNIELQLLQARFSAKQNQPLETETALNKSTKMAVENGCRNQMMRTARIAGWCKQQLNQPTEAALAYKQALSLAQHEEKNGPWPQEVLLSLTGLQQIKGVHSGLMEKTLKVLPEALKSPEPWWQLKLMLGLLSQLATTEPQAFADLVERKPLKVLLDAAGQRVDCLDALAVLTMHLEQQPLVAAS